MAFDANYWNENKYQVDQGTSNPWGGHQVDASSNPWAQTQVDPTGGGGSSYSGFGSQGMKDVYGNPITGDEFKFDSGGGEEAKFWNASLNATGNNQNSQWGGYQVDPTENPWAVNQGGTTGTIPGINNQVDPKESFSSTIPKYPTRPIIGIGETAANSSQFSYNPVLGDPNASNLQPWQLNMLNSQKNSGLLQFQNNASTSTNSEVVAGAGTVPPTVNPPELTPEQLQYQARVKALQGAGQSMSKFGSSMLGKEYEYSMFG